MSISTAGIQRTGEQHSMNKSILKMASERQRARGPGPACIPQNGKTKEQKKRPRICPDGANTWQAAEHQPYPTALKMNSTPVGTALKSVFKYFGSKSTSPIPFSDNKWSHELDTGPHSISEKRSNEALGRGKIITNSLK